MNAVAPANPQATLPGMIRRAADALARATTSAEVLDARDMAGAAYDAAKRAARFTRAREAHDSVLAAVHRAQADALEIEAAAKRRLVDEYDAAQERKEVGQRTGRPRKDVPDENDFQPASAADVGLSRKDVHESRRLRDAMAANPNIVRDVLGEMVERGDEPTRAALKRVISPVSRSIRADDQAAKKARRAEREQQLGARQAALPPLDELGKKYGVIVADPEWRFEPWSRESGMDRAADNHYPTTGLLDLMRRDVGAIAADDCVLFLWATVPMLVEAICVLDAWGFAWIDRDASTGFLAPNTTRCRYVTHFAWLKQKIVTGYWNRGKHEVLLVATRGNPVAPAMGDQLPSWTDGEAVAADAACHSAKPETFLEWIETQWPSTAKIELNRRGPARPGWDAWGNESEPDPAGARQSNPANTAGADSPSIHDADRPSVTPVELNEWKALGAIESGVPIEGPMLTRLRDGLYVTAGKTPKLTERGEAMLAALDRAVSDASDGDGVNVRDDGEAA